MAGKSRFSEFEVQAHAAIGRMVVIYSRLDVNLALFVAGYQGPERRARVLTELDSTSFRAKLDLVMPAVEHAHPGCEECRAEWSVWLERANRLRCLRNDLIHGRWGLSEVNGFVANVMGLPGLPTQREVRYTLDELEDEVNDADRVSEELWRLSHKWPA
jgi:hypothetical protein